MKLRYVLFALAALTLLATPVAGADVVAESGANETTTEEIKDEIWGTETPENDGPESCEEAYPQWTCSPNGTVPPPEDGDSDSGDGDSTPTSAPTPTATPGDGGSSPTSTSTQSDGENDGGESTETSTWNSSSELNRTALKEENCAKYDPKSTKHIFCDLFYGEAPLYVFKPETLGFQMVQDLTGETDELSSTFQQRTSLAFGLPAPGSADDPMSWMGVVDSPEQYPEETENQEFLGMWENTWLYYWVFGFIGFAGLLPALMFAMGKGRKAPDRGTAKRVARGFVMILGGWFVVAFVFHFGNELGLAMAPEVGPLVQTTELLNSADNKMIAHIVGMSKSLFLLTAVGILYIQHILAFLLLALWPLMWTMLAYRSTMARTAGRVGLTFLGALVVLKVMQSTLFNFLTAFPAGGELQNHILATVAVAVAFIVLPYTVLTRLVPRTLLIFGLHEIRNESVEYRNYQERMGNIRREFQDSVRGRFESMGQLGTGSADANGVPFSNTPELGSGSGTDPSALPSSSADGTGGTPSGTSNALDGSNPDEDSRAMKRARRRIDRATDERGPEEGE